MLSPKINLDLFQRLKLLPKSPITPTKSLAPGSQLDMALSVFFCQKEEVYAPALLTSTTLTITTNIYIYIYSEHVTITYIYFETTIKV